MGNLIKRSMVRGVAYTLARSGLAEFPSKIAMDEVADAVADTPEVDAVSDEECAEGCNPDTISAIASSLMDLAQQLQNTSAPAAKTSSINFKVAMEQVDLAAIAPKVAFECMQKAAAEVQLDSGTENSVAAAQGSDQTGVAQIDAMNRPAGFADVDQGQTSFDTSAGEIGALQDVAGASPAVGNSLTEDIAKSAAYVRHLLAQKAAADDATNIGTALPNDIGQSLGMDQTGVMAIDQMNRPGNDYAMVNPGDANFSLPQELRVGGEFPVYPSNTVPVDNSLVAASHPEMATPEQAKAAALSALFDETAQEVGPYIPSGLPDSVKIAAVRKMIGMTPNERMSLLVELKQAAEGSGAPLSRQVAASQGTDALAKIREIANSAN